VDSVHNYMILPDFFRTLIIKLLSFTKLFSFSSFCDRVYDYRVVTVTDTGDSSLPNMILSSYHMKSHMYACELWIIILNSYQQASMQEDSHVE